MTPPELLPDVLLGEGEARRLMLCGERVLDVCVLPGI
jgi:hypothetical protein